MTARSSWGLWVCRGVQAPGEGEAQAAHMSIKGDADYCASQDYDSLLFGACKLLRNVTISGRRKRGKVTVEVVPEVVELPKTWNWREYWWDAFGHFYVVVCQGFDVFVAFFYYCDDGGASGFHLLMFPMMVMRDPSLGI